MHQFHGIFFLDLFHFLDRIVIFMENIQKSFREIDLFDFTIFFGLDFFKFSGPPCSAGYSWAYLVKPSTPGPGVYHHLPPKIIRALMAA